MKDITLTLYYEEDGTRIFNGDCREVLPLLADCSVDSVVTDPPYELGFMGKSWDRSGIAYQVEVWRECFRVLKHGGHLLAFGGSRTYHRLACAIEDAGFEIRDQIQWIYGSGFPKSLDVSKAIDAAAGAERKVIGHRGNGASNKPNGNSFDDDGYEWSTTIALTVPTTDAAKQWNGWGTALKPAQEILTVAYKPHEYDRERDKMDANLSLLEARLWLLLPASIAEKHFQLSPQEYVEACGSVQMNADEWRSIQDGLLGQMDTSRCVSVMSTCLNIVRSWKSILDALCEVTNTSTIETKTSLITDLRILNYSLSQTTPSIIIKAASQADGQALNALPVAQHFAAAQLKLNGILTLSALDAATSKAHTLHRAATESNGIVLARKPLIGTVAENVLKHGTGGINVDGCRIETSDQIAPFGSPRKSVGGLLNKVEEPREGYEQSNLGRWPANVIHDGSDEVADLFPETETHAHTQNGYDRNDGRTFGTYARDNGVTYPSNSGSAARFFYCAKASKEDRDEGLAASRNHHPTVKPTELMRYLVRLVTPPSGTVLDPFGGSGSTARACALEDFKAILIEKELEYCEIAMRRAQLRQRRLMYA